MVADLLAHADVLDQEAQPGATLGRKSREVAAHALRRLAEQGQPWATGPDPDGGFDRMVQLRRERRMRFPMKQCYWNAWCLVEADPWFRYAEGFAESSLPGVAGRHGWAVTPGGFVIDPTWCGVAPPPPGRVYFGIVYPRERVARSIAESGRLWGGMLPELEGCSSIGLRRSA